MHSLKRRGRVVAVAATIGLLAAACGSDSEPIDTAAGDQVAVNDATDESTSGADSGSAPDAQDPAADADSTSEQAETEGPSPVVTDHLFPDLNTVNIADGSSLNLARLLAGGDTPVMLWFFAPH